MKQHTVRKFVCETRTGRIEIWTHVRRLWFYETEGRSFVTVNGPVLHGRAIMGELS